MSDPTDVTAMLGEIEAGDHRVADELVQLLYDDLRRKARDLLRAERPGPTLQATVLVHEAYARLVTAKDGGQAFESRQHFFNAAAKAMRRIVVDHARTRDAKKRGGGLPRLPVDPGQLLDPDRDSTDVLAVDEVLAIYAKRDPQKARLVELRYWGGLTLEEIAALLGTSLSSVERDWNVARARLKQLLEKE